MVFVALKRRSIQQLDYSMAMPEPQKSAEKQIFRSSHAFYTKKSMQS